MELEWGTEDEEYLEKVERNVRRSLQEHLPDVVVYNAGTDVLEGDRLGGLSISPAVRPSMGSPEHSPVAWPQSHSIPVTFLLLQENPPINVATGDKGLILTHHS